ncbi:uncharacterized protein VP01_1058g8 [Puccinia sorghi]|uniref:Alkaline ceramidase n=1 Tax=Puccinia sorghi TaxID=27349 RepID=A0A0L6VVC8_9BASI|nr:uncharacterized protein VP01_1058g8 [Puccinia sorghi]
MVLAPNLHVTRWWSNQPPVHGYWGPSEANYTITKFIAEFTNTLSNLAIAGIALVGVGSFLFHATLRYEWQLGDELPMIFCCTFIAYVTFDTRSASLPRTPFVRCLPYLLVLYSFGVSAVYIRYPYPVIHQAAFGFIQLVATFRAAYTVRTAPERTYREKRNKADATRYTLMGALKEHLGTPWSFILEGHAWWHLATGTGSYLSVVGLQLMSASLKESAEGFEMRRAGLFGLCPYVARISTKLDSKIL